MKKILGGFITGVMFASATLAYASSPVKLFFNGEMVNTDVPPQIISGRTMVPIRVIAEKFNAVVTWDEATGSVYITTNTGADSNSGSGEAAKKEGYKTGDAVEALNATLVVNSITYSKEETKKLAKANITINAKNTYSYSQSPMDFIEGWEIDGKNIHIGAFSAPPPPPPSPGSAITFDAMHYVSIDETVTAILLKGSKGTVKVLLQ